MVSVDKWLNKNRLLVLNFFFISFILWSNTNFLLMKLIVSFPHYIEVSLGQLKKYKEPVIDPKSLLKIEATSFCFDNNLSFQATLYFLVYNYFYLRSTVYMLSKMVWNYNQH